MNDLNQIQLEFVSIRTLHEHASSNAERKLRRRSRIAMLPVPDQQELNRWCEIPYGQCE